MCLDHPKKVTRAAILDIIPQHHLLNNVTRQWGTFSWHWFFNIQPYDMPERMMGADPDWFIEKKLAKTKQGLSFFDPATLAEYKRCFRNPDTIHAICEDYRATFGVDLEMDTKDFEAGRKIECPVLLLWGATGGVGRNHKPGPAEIWKHYASNIVGGQGAAVRTLSVRGSAGGDDGRAAGVLRGDEVRRYTANGAGSVRNSRTTCHIKWRLMLISALCAVFGSITNCRSPFGSCW